MKRLRTAVAIVAVLVCIPIAARADAVLDWNAIAVTTVTSQSPALSPFQQARFMAIIQLAVFEAVNSIKGDYDSTLVGPVVAPSGASADAAAVAASYAALKFYFPTRAAAADTAYAAWLLLPDFPGRSDGIATGRKAAERVIGLRNSLTAPFAAIDGSSPATFYLPESTAVGVWQLTLGCPPLGGVNFQWQNITPFGIPSVLGNKPWTERFRPGPPPALTSREYREDFNEVQRVGNKSAPVTDRPTDRADVARFYAASSQSLIFNQAARQVAATQGKSLSENARALALINVATSDSLISSFETKYHYKFWRPETAIRDPRSEQTVKQPKTVPDTGFLPYVTTPCFPSYPSNHATGSNAAADILRRLYGPGGHEITITNPALPLLTYHYKTFKQITDDIDDARIYGGIHFRFDQEAGTQLGRDIARYIYKHNLRPVKDSDDDNDNDRDHDNEREHDGGSKDHD